MKVQSYSRINNEGVIESHIGLLNTEQSLEISPTFKVYNPIKKIGEHNILLCGIGHTNAENVEDIEVDITIINSSNNQIITN